VLNGAVLCSALLCCAPLRCRRVVPLDDGLNSVNLQLALQEKPYAMVMPASTWQQCCIPRHACLWLPPGSKSLL
jgi:hypothetical protein